MDETKAASGGDTGTGDTPPLPRPNETGGGSGRMTGDASPSVVRTDAATFEVVKNSLYAVAEEMKVVLAKTAYSPILKVAGDYSCGVFDARGNMVAQGPDLPIHLGSMPDAVRAVTEAWGDDIGPGDTFIHNDPYFGGSHLPDVNVVTPAFVGDGGTLLGFCCVRAHWPDIGSATPGSYGAVTEIYGEGLRLPPVRIRRAGRVNRDVEDIIFTNVRTPAERRGDLRAQIAANQRACDRLAALAHKYGPENLARIMQEVMDYSETMMRGLLRELPDGEGVVRGLLRRRRNPRPGREPGRDVQHPAAGGQARRPPDGRLHGLRPPGPGAHERAALGHRVRGVRRAQDGSRFRRRGAAQLGGVAPDRGARPGRDGRERDVSGSGGVRQPRDLAPGVRHGVRRACLFHAGSGHGLLPGDVGSAHAGRRRLPH